MEELEYGREVLRLEAQAVAALVDLLDESFRDAVDHVAGCAGHVVATGMGKSGIIAQKISATLASTGTPSFYLHPAEASHGDLGRVGPRDVVVALSNSGSSDEILRLRDDAEILRASAKNFHDLRQITGSLFNGDDIFHVARQTQGCFGGDVGGSASGNVVDNNRKTVHCFGDGAKMLVESFLGRLVVIRRNAEDGVGSESTRGSRFQDRGCGGIASRAGDYFRAAASKLNRCANDEFVFRVRHGHAFARRAAGHEHFHAAANLIFN
jgi:hypothetical protein